MQREDLNGGMHTVMLLPHSQDSGLEIDVQAVLNACRIVKLWVLEDESRGIGVTDRAGSLLRRGGDGRGVDFAETEVVLAEGGVKAGDENSVAVKLSDVRNGAWVADGVCLGTEFRDAEICDVEDASAATGEKDGGTFREEFEGEDVGGICFVGDGPGTDEKCIAVPLVYCYDAVASSKGEEEAGFWRRCSRRIYAHFSSL